MRKLKVCSGGIRGKENVFLADLDVSYEEMRKILNAAVASLRPGGTITMYRITVRGSGVEMLNLPPNSAVTGCTFLGTGIQL